MMNNTKVNLNMPVNSGEMKIKELKGFPRPPKLNGISKSDLSPNRDNKLFSEKLKEFVLDDSFSSEDIPKKLREPDAGLNPVKPKCEKQGGVMTPAYSDREVTIDKGFRQGVEISSDIAVDSGFSIQQNPVSTDNGQTDSELLNSFGYNVNATDEGTDNLADVNNQSVLLQLQGVFVPAANNVSGQQIVLNDVQEDDENEETEPVLGVDTENKPNTVRPSVANSELLTEVVKTEKAEDETLPLQNDKKDNNTDKTVENEADKSTESKADKTVENEVNKTVENKADKTVENKADKNVEKSSEKVTGKVEKGKPIQAAALFKGTLEELIKQGEIDFGDIITFKVTDKGIFIGGEGDSTEDLANLVEVDFLQKIFDVLSETLENTEKPTVSEEFRQLLITAIQKAVSDMHDPVKREEEYQQKLVEFLMKFVDAINGKDDDKDKKVALEDDDSKDKGDLLLQIIENLIEAAKKNSDDDKRDDYTAGIYISAFEITLLNSEQNPEESEETEETEADPTAAVEQVSDVRTDRYSDSYQAKEPVHKTVENAVDVTAVNEERTVRYLGETPKETAVYSEETPKQTVVYSEKISEETVVYSEEYADTVPENVSSVIAESSSNAVNTVSQRNTVVDTAVVNTAETNVNVQKTETVNVENVQSVSFDKVYEAVQPAELDGKGSQSNADSSRKSTGASISSVNRYGRRVQNNSDEVEELKRLFGIKTSRDDKRLKEKNDILESTEEDGQENKTGVDENQGTVRAIGKDQEQKGLDGIDKSIIESVTLEAIKADNTAVAKGYTPEENGVKQIAAQIISEMLNNLSDGSHSERTVTTLTMTLNPESLGKITMKISEEAGKISLLVTAHNKETAEILSQRMEAMQQAAKDSGTQLEKYQVVYGPEQDDRAGQQNYDGSSKNPYVRQDTEETHKEVDSQFAELLKQAV